MVSWKKDIIVEGEGLKEKDIKLIIEKLWSVGLDILQGYETGEGQDWISEYVDIDSKSNVDLKRWEYI